MTVDEFKEFLFGLYKASDKKKFANDFYQQMLVKYGNQFDSNGLIDELIEILNGLK